jgi:peptidoglycan/xylan/chitin deacetylase (PgdA/CDA1 family)
MYHVIAEPRPDAAHPELWVRPDDFRDQVQALRRRGYHGVTLSRVVDYWKGRAKLPRHPIVVSFDDGYQSHYKEAFPVLRAARWPGVVDVAVKNLGVEGGLRPRRVRELIESGWEVAAHTTTHPDLTSLPADRLEDEVAGSRATLRRLFRVPVDSFSYPEGRFDPTVVEAVRAAGFRGATTTVEGLATRTDLFALARLRVDGGDGVAGLLEKLDTALPVEGAQPPVAAVQGPVGAPEEPRGTGPSAPTGGARPRPPAPAGPRQTGGARAPSAPRDR